MPTDCHAEEQKELEAVLQRMRRYCAYRERSVKEAQDKLAEHGLPTAAQQVILDRLQAERYLDERRFALAFARGKFRLNGWGKAKIVSRLRQLATDEDAIAYGLAEIDAADYQAMLQKALRKKDNQLAGDTEASRRAKLMGYALQKGYEPEAIYKALDMLVGSREEPY